MSLSVVLVTAENGIGIPTFTPDPSDQEFCGLRRKSLVVKRDRAELGML
jgi:hypothetical protein